MHKQDVFKTAMKDSCEYPAKIKYVGIGIILFGTKICFLKNYINIKTVIATITN
jgi:hypothetical protein